MTYNLDKYYQLADRNYYRHLGKVVKIVGLTIESVGPNAKLNDLCRIIIQYLLFIVKLYMEYFLKYICNNIYKIRL